MNPRRMKPQTKQSRFYFSRTVLLLSLSGAILSGCGGKDDAASAPQSSNPAVAAALASKPKDPVDLTQFLKAFESADSSIKLYADETVAVIRARSYRDAVEQLQKLSRNPKLTAEQRQAITDLTQKIQTLPAGR